MATLLVSFQNCSPAKFSKAVKKAQGVGNLDNGGDDDDDDDDDNCTSSNLSDCDPADCEFYECTPKFNGSAIVAYEDLYPNRGDADYNDFVFRATVSENFNSKNQLTDISIKIEPLARGAGHNHALYLVADGKKDGPTNITFESAELFSGGGAITVEHYQGQTNVLKESKVFAKDKDAVIFNSTQAVLPLPPGVMHTNTVAGTKFQESTETVIIKIAVNEPTLQGNFKPNRDGIELNKYRFVLHDHDTNKDIDLVVVNRQDGMIDSAGFPFGMVFIDPEFRYPMEGIHIDSVYPLFVDFRNWLKNGGPITQQVFEWYKHPGANSDGKIFRRDLFL